MARCRIFFERWRWSFVKWQGHASAICGRTMAWKLLGARRGKGEVSIATRDGMVDWLLLCGVVAW
jgi:hypothetical protein